MSDFPKHLLLPEDYDKQSSEVRLKQLINLMMEIHRMDITRDIRSRFASQEQFEYEYGKDSRKNLIIAFMLIKEAYLKYESEFVILRDRLDNTQRDFFDIMKKICDDEAEARFLLEGEDEGD